MCTQYTLIEHTQNCRQYTLIEHTQNCRQYTLIEHTLYNMYTIHSNRTYTNVQCHALDSTNLLVIVSTTKLSINKGMENEHYIEVHCGNGAINYYYMEFLHQYCLLD